MPECLPGDGTRCPNASGRDARTAPQATGRDARSRQQRRERDARTKPACRAASGSGISFHQDTNPYAACSRLDAIDKRLGRVARIRQYSGNSSQTHPEERKRASNRRHDTRCPSRSNSRRNAVTQHSSNANCTPGKPGVQSRMINRTRCPNRNAVEATRETGRVARILRYLGVPQEQSRSAFSPHRPFPERQHPRHCPLHSPPPASQSFTRVAAAPRDPTSNAPRLTGTSAPLHVVPCGRVMFLRAAGMASPSIPDASHSVQRHLESLVVMDVRAKNRDAHRKAACVDARVDVAASPAPVGFGPTS